MSFYKSSNFSQILVKIYLDIFLFYTFFFFYIFFLHFFFYIFFYLEPTKELTEVVLNVFSKVKESNMLLSILPSLPLEKIKQFLPDILELYEKKHIFLESAIDILINITHFTKDFVISLHKLENIPRKSRVAALRILLKKTNIFTENEMVDILRELIYLDNVPQLFMLTVIPFFFFFFLFFFEDFFLTFFQTKNSSSKQWKCIHLLKIGRSVLSFLF